MEPAQTPKKKFRLKIRHYLLAIVVAFVLMAMWVSHLQNVADKTFASLAPLCDGKSPSSAASKAGAKKGIAFEHKQDQSWEVAMFTIPSEATADRPEDVKFVACVDPERSTSIGRCSFQKGVGLRVLGIKVAGVSAGDITIYDRLQHELPIRVIDPADGRLLGEGLVLGKTPPECENYVGDVSKSTFDGDKVDKDAVSAWLTEQKIL